MALSLDPKKNPLLRLYELFEVTGVKTEDSPSALRVYNLPLKWAESGAASELAGFLRQEAGNALTLFRLYWDKKRLADFAQGSVSDWFEWNNIEELAGANKLCDQCAELFQDLQARMEAKESGADWPDAEQDSISVLNDLETCPTCGPHFTLEATVDKDSLVNQLLIGEVLSAGKKISGLVWYDPEHMTQSFDSFQVFLEFIAGKASAPLVLFFYQPMEPYPGFYFKILPLRSGLEVVELEKELAGQLSAYTSEVLTAYRMLRTDHMGETRTALGETLRIPPSLFLRQAGELATYPSHTVFVSGPIRSLLIYAIMAWLARQTEKAEGSTVFMLPEDEEDSFKVSLTFSRTDVQRDGHSIFVEDKWSVCAGLLARDISQSVGSNYFRECWVAAMQGLTADDFTAGKLFATLEAVRERAAQLRQEPPEDIRNLTPDLALQIHVDAVRKEIIFQLNYLNPELGLRFKDVGSLSIKMADQPLPIGELNELAKRNLTAILDTDQQNPGLKVPNMERLETRGKGLWADMIPEGLKRAYAQLRRNKDLTLFIFSEDRSFPWELVRPYEMAGSSEIDPAGFDDLWWALQFSIARWVAGSPSPANRIPINRVCCVAASSALSSAEKEVGYFESLKAQGVVVDQPKTKAELIDYLSNRDYDVIHFACHGQFNTQDPGESDIQLPDGTLLQPDSLFTGKIPERIGKNHPLIFLNSCHSGRTGSTLVGIEGWAKRLIEWGCGAFIGCGWEVADRLAADFAVIFYQNFRNNKSLGQAVHQARRQIREQNEQNSTWLAYYLYGNPNCCYQD
jgi:CHAT domain